MSTGRTVGLLLAGTVIAAAGYGVSYWYPIPGKGESDPPAPQTSEIAGTPSRIEALGRLEPVSGTLTVGALPGEEVVKLLAYVGQEVKKGQELAVLGSKNIRETEYQLALEQLKKAELQLKSERSLAVLRLEAAKLQEQQAEAKSKEIPPEDLIRVAELRKTLGQEQLKKLQELRDNPQTRDAISEAELEQQSLLIQQIDAELQQNRAKLEAAREAQILAMQAAEIDSKMVRLSQDSLDTVSPIEVFKQTANLAKLAAEATDVTAPCDGTILDVYVREGERVANTPILQMGDLSRMVCIAEVHEANLQDIEVTDVVDGDNMGKLVPAKEYAVTIKSAAFKQDLKGKLTEVGRLIGAPALRDPNPLAKSDRRTANVRIELDEQSTQIAKRFVQLQVKITIHLQEPDSAGPL